jgi:hypothetical protein
MPVKLDPIIIEELASMDLTLWEAKHPRTSFVNAAGKMSSREDKSWVLVYLAGPGVIGEHGGGPTLRQAVDAALVYSGLCERVPGVRGAMLRLEKEVGATVRQLVEGRCREADDDDIPF